MSTDVIEVVVTIEDAPPEITVIVSEVGLIGPEGPPSTGGGGGSGNLSSVNGDEGPDVVLDAADVGADPAGAAAAVQATLAAVATSGAYGDLSGRPTIPSIAGLATSLSVAQADAIIQAAVDAVAANLAAHLAATDPHGDRAYTDTKIAALIGGAPGLTDTLGEIAAILAADEAGVATLTTAVNARLVAANNLSDLTSPAAARTALQLAAVAASGAYADLTGKPTIPTTPSEVGADPAGAAAAVSSALATHAADHANPHVVTKAQVGLGNVDNTADTAKPVSIAQAAADALALAKASNLSDLASVSAARTNLGLGTAATQATTAFDAAGAAAAAQAASQPLDSDLTAIAALSTTTFGRALLALADAAAGRTALGLGSAALSAASAFDASGAAAAAQAASQPVDSDLTAIAALATTTFGRALLTQADAAATRTALGLGTAATVDTGTASGQVPVLGASGTLAVARLATGTPTGSKFVRDDGTLAVPAGGSLENIPRRELQPAGTITATLDRLAINLGSVALTSGTSYYGLVRLTAGDVLTNFNWRIGTVATVTHQWCALLDASRVVLCGSADDTTASPANGANGGRQNAIVGGPYTVLASGLYVVEFMLAAGSTSVFGFTYNTAPVATVAPAGGPGATGQTTAPTVGTTRAAPTAAAGTIPWVWIT